MGKFSIRYSLLNVALIAAAAHDAQSQPPPVNLLGWSVVVTEADALAPTPRSYRLFQTAENISLVFTLFNQSGSPLYIDRMDFITDATIRVSRETELATEVLWQSAIRRSGESFLTPLSPQDQIRIEAGAGLTWRATLRLVDGSLFPPGNYDVVVDLTRALKSVKNVDGSPWQGISLPVTTLRLTIAAPATPVELASMHRLFATAALAENRPADALTSFTRALEATPADPDVMAGIGNAYLSLGQYPLAIKAYEQALPGLRGQRTGVPLLLAFAYIASGDEPNAVRILRLDGRSETDIQREVQLLRERIARKSAP